MRAPAIILSGVLLSVLVAYLVASQIQDNALKGMDISPSRAISSMPYGMWALAGSWGGFSKNNIPIRLVVEDVRSEWALVLFAWGRNADGSRPRGSIRTRAKILPDGRLCISYPVHLIFPLSEDSRVSSAPR
jgi:hypothetical protein